MGAYNRSSVTYIANGQTRPLPPSYFLEGCSHITCAAHLSHSHGHSPLPLITSDLELFLQIVYNIFNSIRQVTEVVLLFHDVANRNKSRRNFPLFYFHFCFLPRQTIAHARLSVVASGLLFYSNQTIERNCWKRRVLLTLAAAGQKVVVQSSQ